MGGRIVLVDVAVFLFLGGGFADLNHLDIELEVDAGEGVIGVDGDGIAIDGGDDGDLRAGLRLGLEAHAWFEFDIVGELGAGGFDDAFRVVIAVGFGGGDLGGGSGPGGQAFELFFETGDDIAVAVEVGQRIAAFGGIEDFSLGIAKSVMHGDDAVGFNFHSKNGRGGCGGDARELRKKFVRKRGSGVVESVVKRLEGSVGGCQRWRDGYYLI